MDEMKKASDLQALPERKQRGAFFTPPEIAEFLVSWAIRSERDLILEPSCGEAAFLLSAIRRLKQLGASPTAISGQLFGVDVHRESIAESERLVRSEGVHPNLMESSFFSVDCPQSLLKSPIPIVNAVVGNPPFIRYQQFGGSERRTALAAALRQGVSLSGLASSWAAFLVHASGFLDEDGRLAMVLPAELLTVNYSEAIRRFLLRRFAEVHLIHFKRLVFKDALEDVVLLLAEGSGGTPGLFLHLLDDELALASFDHSRGRAELLAEEGKWTELLLPAEARRLVSEVGSEWFVSLVNYGIPQLGTVTGANDFFSLRPSQVKRMGLREPQVTRISPPGTKHLKGLRFTNRDWHELEEADARVWLLTLTSSSPLGDSLTQLISEGEKSGTSLRYKCRIREPWYVVPPVRKPDLFFTYMSHRFPRLIANAASVGVLNTMHGVQLSDNRRIGLRALPIAAMTSFTQLSAEIVGRSYGGGILKLEPREAGRLLLPRPDLVERFYSTQRNQFDRLEDAVRKGDWSAVNDFADEIFLKGLAGLSHGEVQVIKSAVDQLRSKRLERGKSLS